LILAKIVYDFQHDLLLNTCSGLLDTRGLIIYTAEDNSVSYIELRHPNANYQKTTSRFASLWRKLHRVLLSAEVVAID